ncbi:MAG: MarR family winged helix-turn-helix transcriptional regulator [Solirubrobacteraceae bacterium]
MTSRTQTSTGALAEAFESLSTRMLKSADVFRTVGELELSVTHYKMLVLLDEEDSGLSLKDVAERLGLSFSAVSRAVDGLCQRAYVGRLVDETDRRIKRVRIAPAGAEVISKVRAVRVKVIARELEGLTDEQRSRLAAALAPLLERTDATP